jgi:hypothetical protein
MAKKLEKEVKEFPKVFIAIVDGEEHELIARDEIQAAAFEKQEGLKEKE